MRITNDLNLPEPFVDAARGEHAYTPRRYSATDVIGGIRKAILQRRHDDEISVDASEQVWAIFGTAVHTILERASEGESQIKENKIVVTMPNGYELSGIFDLYDAETRTVTDYKTASVWKVNFGDFDEWRAQLNIYAYLLRAIGFDVDRVQVVALLKDHSKTKAMTGEHPPLPVFVKEWPFRDADYTDTDAFLRRRFEEIAAAEELADDDLPLCTEKERWSRGESYAVMKKGSKKAKKLFRTSVYKEDAEWRAYDYASAMGAGYTVEHRPGVDARCDGYCSAAPFCSHYRKSKEA